MRFLCLFLVVLFTLTGCKIAENAAQNAKPASAPTLSEKPPFSAWWPDENKFYLGSKHFAMIVEYNLFNQLSVKLDGVVAQELPRGGSLGAPLDKSQLAPDKVYFRLTSIYSNVNTQRTFELLEVVDTGNILRDQSVIFPLLPQVVSEVDLVVGERSINPTYVGTPNEYRETTVRVVYGRGFIGPVGTYASQCDLEIRVTSGSLRPGDTLYFDGIRRGCKQVTSYVRDQIDLKNYRQVARKTFAVSNNQTNVASASYVVPPQDNSSWITVAVEGVDWLKRPVFHTTEAWVEYVRPRPANPCDAGNGNNGQRQNFGFCAKCDSNLAVPYLGSACTRDEAENSFKTALDNTNQKNCQISNGLCSPCPSDNGHNGATFNIDYCVTCQRPADTRVFGVCSADAAKDYLENLYGGCTITQGVCAP